MNSVVYIKMSTNIFCTSTSNLKWAENEILVIKNKPFALIMEFFTMNKHNVKEIFQRSLKKDEREDSKYKYRKY